MPERNRRHIAPPYRRSTEPRHPMGRARRRWPRAYDGAPPEPRMNPRYRRGYDRERRHHESGFRRRRSVPGMERLRQSPVRNGLLGLAMVGAAAPVAAHRYQQMLRTDTDHQRVSKSPSGPPASDASVSEAWQRLASGDSAIPEAASPDTAPELETQREAAIQRNLQRHRDMGLSRDLAEKIYDTAINSQVDPDVAFGLVRAESNFKNSATSPVGAVGLTQLMPKTAKWLEPGITRGDLRDPDTNLRIGFRYLRQLLDRYEGDSRLALTAYNRGPGTVDRALKRGQNPDNGYADYVYTGNVGSHKMFTR